MSFYSGRHGSLIYLGKPVAKVREWSFDYSTEMLETTTVADFAPTYVPGRKSAEGAATIYWYRLAMRDMEVNTAFQQLMTKLVHTGTGSAADRIQLELAVGKAVGESFLINAYLTNASFGSISGEVSNARVAFRMTGDLLGGPS